MWHTADNKVVYGNNHTLLRFKTLLRVTSYAPQYKSWSISLEFGMANNNTHILLPLICVVLQISVGI